MGAPSTAGIPGPPATDGTGVVAPGTPPGASCAITTPHSGEQAYAHHRQAGVHAPRTLARSGDHRHPGGDSLPRVRAGPPVRPDGGLHVPPAAARDGVLPVRHRLRTLSAPACSHPPGGGPQAPGVPGGPAAGRVRVVVRVPVRAAPVLDAGVGGG